MQIASALRAGTALLAEPSTQSMSPKLDAEVLLAHVLGVPRVYLMTWPEQPLSSAQQLKWEQLLAQRQQGVPVAHLTGQREFWSLPLQVDNSTLIPRPDTELLVELALQVNLPPQARVVDLGTGTGAIALALKSERPQWNLLAVDASEGAVQLAQRNAEQLQLAIKVMHSDWFSALSQQRFDLVVSNPPYIDAADPHLQQGDVRFEPASALIAEEHGLADIAWIIEHARDHLTDSGQVLIEHGWQQGPAVRELFAQFGYEKIKSYHDYANLERVSAGCWQS